MLTRYGTAARAVLAAEGATPAPLPDAADYSMQELDWLARNETVVHLDDLVMRRTALAITGGLSAAGLEAASKAAATALGWDEPRRKQEIERTQRLLTEKHRLRF